MRICLGIIYWNKRDSDQSARMHSLIRAFPARSRRMTPLLFTHDTDYRKNSKNWDTLNYYRDCPTNGIVGFYSAILRSKDADRITNRVDTDQTAP